MRATIQTIVLLALLAVAAGCLPTQQQQRMEQEFAEMKRRLAATERSLADRGQNDELSGRLEGLARSQADRQANLDNLRVDIQSFNGRLDDLAQQRQEMSSELALLRDEFGLKLSAIEDRLAKLEQAPPPRPVAPPVRETPESLYQQGLEAVQNRGDFAAGRQALQDFLKRYPQHDLAVNAMYWIGEAYYGEKKYENAILQFQDVIQKFGDHPKVASALLKQAIAFHSLGDVKNAKLILQKLSDSFPLSGEAKKSKELLAQW